MLCLSIESASGWESCLDLSWFLIFGSLAGCPLFHFLFSCCYQRVVVHVLFILLLLCIDDRITVSSKEMCGMERRNGYISTSSSVKRSPRARNFYDTPKYVPFIEPFLLIDGWVKPEKLIFCRLSN
ncbi:uncharacterized protein B0T23DRAFT_385289 [Neurospora hispaniola]|uniref:Uncharacterized protein n=1 Tax=Neurospora hispaniola TaxID=588809 RepID=A0AAJ0I431_9PEZI|nr:hypothetical protein B0T23DRAFT_385289 [Neurospora hispaniola]